MVRPPPGCTWSRSLNALPLVSLVRSCPLSYHRVFPHCGDSQDMSHHLHRMTSGKRRQGDKLPDMVESWLLALGWLFFFFFSYLDSLPPTSWDAGYPDLPEGIQREQGIFWNELK